MNLLIDTCLLVEAEREDFDLGTLEKVADAIWICDATYVEYLQGQPVKDEGKRRRWRDFLESVVESMPSLPLDRASCELAGSLMHQARQNGHTVNLGDGLHAGVAKLHNLTVATIDEAHFKQMGIPTINPMASNRPSRQTSV
jgi:predicted nucleic acid-binding protein